VKVPDDPRRGGAALTDWEPQLKAALRSARAAGTELQSHFGGRAVSEYRGRHDVQLKADILAHRIIAESLSAAFPDYGLLSEEGECHEWPDKEHTWVVDPLDGTNNFGYGIAHCAISITLFRRERVVMALIADPLLNREFYATEHAPMTRVPDTDVPLRRATVSLVTNYSDEGREWGSRVSDFLGAHCKRTVSLWAPALDLALVATGAMDAVVCHHGYLLDVCGGLFLVESAGGVVLDLAGKATTFRRPHDSGLVSFIAARSPELAAELAGRLAGAGFAP
jgi:myo-inositol-1(or 4)-monophosphatase